MIIAFFKKIARALDKVAATGPGYSLSRSRRGRMRAPSFNIDGTPMMGSTDVRGRSYGSPRSDT